MALTMTSKPLRQCTVVLTLPSGTAQVGRPFSGDLLDHRFIFRHPTPGAL